MIMLMPILAPEPLLTNDVVGYLKLAVAFVTGMSPVFLLVVWFLRRGPDAEIAKLKTDLTNLGEKVDDMGKDHERDRERQITLQREIAEGHREVVDMLNSSSKAIQDDIHKVDVRMARIEERSDIAECFEKFGKEIAHAVRAARQT